MLLPDWFFSIIVVVTIVALAPCFFLVFVGVTIVLLTYCHLPVFVGVAIVVVLAQCSVSLFCLCW